MYGAARARVGERNGFPCEIRKREPVFLIFVVGQVHQVDEDHLAPDGAPDAQIDGRRAVDRKRVLVVKERAPRVVEPRERADRPGQLEVCRDRKLMAGHVLELTIVLGIADARQRIGHGRLNAPVGPAGLELDADMPAAADVGIRERLDVEIDLVVDVHPVRQGAPPQAGRRSRGSHFHVGGALGFQAAIGDGEVPPLKSG